jgi:hypothetical protein
VGFWHAVLSSALVVATGCSSVRGHSDADQQTSTHALAAETTTIAGDAHAIARNRGTARSLTLPAAAQRAEGGGVPFRAEPPSPVAIPQARVVLTNAPANGTPSQVQAQFSIGTERELFIHTVWSNVFGQHQELRRLYSPDGALFYEKVIPFSSDIAEPAQYTGQHAVPHALVVQPAPYDEQGNVVVSDYIALAGAWIGDHGMIGDWRLEVYLDAAALPSATTTMSFVH